MSEITNEQNGETKLSSLAVFTLITSLLIIPLLYLSAYKIIVHPCPVLYHHPGAPNYKLASPLGLSQQTYRKIHHLCFYLPAVTLVSGLVALWQIASKRKKLHGRAFVISGIVIALTACSIYWITIILTAMGLLR